MLIHQERLRAISPEKHRSFYRYFHPYFTRLPANVAAAYIANYSKERELVLDPFCGSGVVGKEALLLGRASISSDLSPLACFISRQLCNDEINLSLLQDRYHEIKLNIFGLIQKIWSYGDETLYTRTNPFFETLKRDYWFPREAVSYRSNFASIEELFDVRQLLTYAVLFKEIKDTKDKAIRETLLISLFGAMSRANLTYMVSGSREGSVLHNGGSSLFSIYDYRRPKQVVVIPPWERFERKFKDVLRIKEETVRRFKFIDRSVLERSNVVKADVRKLERILKPESVDYIFTDPPYGSKIPYLELSGMWAAWMGWKISSEDLKAEIIEGGELKKSEETYCSLMSEGMASMSTVLKRGRFMSIVFQHTSFAVWDRLATAARENGLEYQYSSIQPTNSASIIKKKFKGDVVSVPLIMTFRKVERRKKSRNASEGFDWRGLEKELVRRSKASKRALTYEEVYNLITKGIFDSNLSVDAAVVDKEIKLLVQKLQIKSLM